MARWYATSTQMLHDPKVVKVGERYGGDTVAVIHGLLTAAMLQEKGGDVEVTFRNLAHDTFTAADKAEEIVNALAETGFLKIESSDGYAVTLRFPAWSRHQATFRKAKSRAASNPTPDANVTSGHDLSQEVTNKTGQERTGQDKKKKPAPADSLPKDFPPDLVATVDSVRPLLQSIADARDAKAVTRLALAKVIQQYPHHAHLKVAQSLDHWLLHGGGEKKPCKDVVARYRFFLDGDKPVAVSRPTVQQSTVERMAEALPEIPKEQIDMHIYRLQQQKRPVTAELIRERHLAVNPERTAA